MSAPALWAPVPLLLHPNLRPSAKLVWLTCLLHPDFDLNRRPGAIAHHTRLSHPTVLRARANLTQAGWAPHSTPRRLRQVGQGARFPARLLDSRGLSASARLLFGQLQLLPGAATEFTYASLSHASGQNAVTLRRAMGQLTTAGWVETTQRSRSAPVRFILRDPDAERQAVELLMVRQRLEESQFRGESLMRESLNLLVDAKLAQDNATPPFLVNPLIDELLQFDRYYSPSVAFEYNGPQHDRSTEHYRNMEVSTQQARDLIKHGICAQQGITLVVVHREDLSLAGMQAKVGQLLPLRVLEGQERVIDLLELSSRAYRSTDAPGIKSPQP